MPNITVEGYRIGFVYADVRKEPSHVHIMNSGKQAKYWLNPIKLSHSRGYANHELGRIEEILRNEHARLMDMWDQAKGQLK